MATYKIIRTGTGLIQILVRFNSDVRKKISTKIYVSADQWDEKKCVVKNHNLAVSHNAEISDKLSGIKSFEARLQVDGKPFNREALDRFLSGDKSDELFNSFMLDQINADRSMKSSTTRDQMQTYNLLNEYGPILFSAINYDFVSRLHNWMLNYPLSFSTCCKHHKNIKKYLTLAAKCDLFTGTPYKKFELKRPKTNRTYLTFDQVKVIRSKEYTSERIKQAADLFVFACCTALRFCDLKALQPPHCTNDVIKILPVKTTTSSGKTVILPLKLLFNGLPFEIWQQYNGNLPKFGNSEYNALLKQVGIESEIPIKLHAHLSRHTCLTNIALTTGDVFKVMAIGGLSKIDTAQVYIHIANEVEGVNKMFEGVKW